MSGSILDSFISKQRQNSLLRYDKIVFFILLAHLPIIMFLVPMGYGTYGFAITASVIAGLIATAGYFLLRGTMLFGVLAAVLL